MDASPRTSTPDQHTHDPRMQYENANVRPGKEGIYQVRKGFGLFFVDRKGELSSWATALQYVDLRSNFFAAYAQSTSQMHKLERVDTIPQGASLIGIENAPAWVRSQFEATGGELQSTPTVAIDPKDLPSIKLPEPKDKSEDNATDTDKAEPGTKATPPKPLAMPATKGKATGGGK